jgi:diguanylate cyclase (GGDEF)-like protein/PAS domain S-box-containing protein
VFTDVLSCIFDQHDFRLVALAGFICCLATYTAFSLNARAQQAAANAQHNWIIAAAVATGCGVWATHFIAMLGFRPHQHATYMLWPTLASIVIAIFISGLGLLLSLRRSWPALLAGGGLIGAGIGAMHYTGMIALESHGQLSYDSTLVTVSIGIGIVLGAAAVMLAFKFPTHAGRLAAAALLTLGICGLHFTGITGMLLDTAGALPDAAEGVPAGLLAIAIAAVTLMILALGLGGALVDESFAARAGREAESLRASETRFRQLANATFEGIIIHDNGIIKDVNETFCRMIGRSQDELIDTNGFSLVREAWHTELAAWLNSDSNEPMEVEITHASGEIIPIEILIRSNEGPATAFRVVAVRDLRERKQALDRIHHLAHHDALTGLPNRKFFLDRLNEAISLSHRTGTTVAVLCLDFDRFKNVNDLLGHWGGDELLRAASARLSKLLRSQDTLARLGGDEFAIVQIGATPPEGAAALAGRLVDAMSEPFQVGDQQVLIGTSIGVALFPGDGIASSDLLRAADTALYRTKEEGRNGFRFFEAAMDVRLQERALLEHDLRAALANEQLEVHYQPLVDCHSGSINGYEALLRWHHPLRGQISPADFIPLAEESGLILPLGLWVLRKSCKAAMSWPDNLKVAVNLSPAQFRHGDLAKDILGELRDSGLAPERLEIEITEGVLITDTDATLRILTQLKTAGVRIALDDFGTGYSSLSYLQRFPFDKIKIDRSFVWQMGQNRESMSIVRAVIALGHSLQIMVTAEGVETSEQLQLLQGERCDQVQGYLLGRPAALPAHSVVAVSASKIA